MNRVNNVVLAIAWTVLLWIVPPDVAAWQEGEPYLEGVTLSESEEKLTAALEKSPNEDQIRFRLGAVQVVRSFEHLAQGLYRHGAGSRLPFRQMLPLPILNVPKNPRPEPIDYETFRQLTQGWLDRLARAELTLAEVRDPGVSLPIRLGAVRLDVNGDGAAGPDESLTAMAPMIFGQRVPDAPGGDELLIRFDHADVAWMRGYCHLLMGLAESLMAYDGHEMFDRTAHLVFADVKSPYPFLQEVGPVPDPVNYGPFLDVIAAVHLIHWPVKEPARLQTAIKHFETMVSLSREIWPLVEKETDNDHEWIPNPRQTSVLPNAGMDAERIAGWFRFLDEAEAILAGKKLIPFWRGTKPLGVNLRRVFTEPTEFDLVLWVQGTAAAPYLEEGSLTSREVWEDLQRVFRGEFIGFAVWLN